MAADGGAGGEANESLQCPTEAQLAVLAAFLEDFDASVGLLAGHPSAAEVTGFLLAPALPKPPGVAGFFAGPLIAPCAEPSMFDPFCQEGRCSRIECTGDGAGWINHVYLDEAPLEAGEDVFEEVTLDNAWSDGADTTALSLEVRATDGDGLSWDLSATGTLGPDAGTLVVVFPALFEAEATLEYGTDRTGHTGSLEIGGHLVATVPPDGGLEPVADCP